MNTPVIVVLLVFWLFLAYRAFQRGDYAMAAVLTAVGVVLTLSRIVRKPPSGGPTPPANPLGPS